MEKIFYLYGKEYRIAAANQEELDDKYFYTRVEIEDEHVKNSNTVRQIGDMWLELYKKDIIVNKNYKGYISILNARIYPYIGDMNISKVTQNNCQVVINKLNGMSKFYIKKVFYTLRNIFETAIRERLITYNPATYLTFPKGHTTHRRALTEYERNLALQVMETNKNGLYFKLMLYCGLRPHECSLIQGKDVVDRRLHIRGVKTDNADRWVIIPNTMLLPDLEKEEFLFKNLTPQKRNRWWNSFKRDMNILAGCKIYRNELIPPLPIHEDLTPYCFRHTYCTDLETAGVSLNMARQLMGHSDISLTSKIYTHTSEISWQLVENQINNFHVENSA